MKLKFWGVRGSLPAPITSSQIQAKISAVVQRITKNDIVSADSREKFIASLPDWIFGTVGGNSPCVELRSNNGTEIILDAGSGIRLLGNSSNLPKDNHYNIFFSHFHWDHIQGFPFFSPSFNSNVSIDFYSPFNDMQKYLENQQTAPYFPVDFKNLKSKLQFHVIEENTQFEVGDFSVCACKMSHPGDSFSYAFCENGKKIVYATDIELTQKDFEQTEEREKVFKNADYIILDSQYTVEEARKKVNWGHSSFCYAVDFAVTWGIKNVYLFHHEPIYDDKKLNSILEAAKWYAKYIVHSDINIFLAKENTELEV